MRTACRRFVVLAGFLLSGRSLVAQSLSGVVVLPDGATPATGVIVVASNDRGAETARALSNARGEYTLRFAAPGRVALKVLRIGYRPTVGPSVDVAAEGKTDAPKIVLATEAISLAAVNIRDRETCRVNADTGLMVARVWEEARKAMSSTQLETGSVPLIAEWIEYDQRLDSAARTVRAQRVRTSRNPTTHAFKSRPAEFLDTAGYVVAENGEITYFAPDAEVLLSEVFAAHHCFRLTESRATPELIGVAFQPSRDRREARDIQGTLWVDRRTNELKTLEYRYTSLSEVAMAAGAGGRVEFLHLDDGSWLVGRWSIRMPQLESRRQAAPASVRTVMATVPVLRAIQVTGGEVTRVVRGDAEVFRAAGPRVAVQVVGTDSLVPVDGAKLSLDGTDYRAVADASGRIEVSPVLAGRYQAKISTTLMDSLGMPPVSGEVIARLDGGVDSLRLPSPRDVLGRSCPRDSISKGEGMIYGRVVDEQSQPISLAAVVAKWSSEVNIIATANADLLRSSETSLTSVTGRNGEWRICGVPRDKPMTVIVMSDAGRDARSVRLTSDFGPVSLVARPGTSAVTNALGANGRATAFVEFVVFSSDGVPLPNTNIEVRAGDATRSILTGPSGMAVLPDIVPGVLAVRARRIGFQQGSLAVRVEAGRNTVPIRLSTVSAPLLDTVRVVGDKRLTALGRLDEFDQRRLTAIGGRFITRENIENQQPVVMTDLLRRVPGILLRDSSGVTLAISGRGFKMAEVGTPPNVERIPVPCTMRVGVDGLLKENGFDINTLTPNDIYGVEIYTPATVPPQYNGSKTDSFCGLIMVWTR